MKYQKIMDFSDTTPNQPSKFKTENLIKINNKSRGTFNKDNQIKFKNSMPRSSLCEYSDAYILVKGTITAEDTAAQGQTYNGVNKKVMFKICASFANCISRINNIFFQL